MVFDMQHVKITPSRYAVTIDGQQIGYCIQMNQMWSFFCNLDNSVTKSVTADMAIAKKIARLQMSKSPVDTGNK